MPAASWTAELSTDTGVGISTAVSSQKFLIGSTVTDLPVVALSEHGFSVGSGNVVTITNVGDIKAKSYMIGVTFTLLQGNTT